MLRLALMALALLGLPLGACTVTPIQLPFSESGVASTLDAAAKVPDRAALDAGRFAKDNTVVPGGDQPRWSGDAGHGDGRAADARATDARATDAGASDAQATGDGRVDGQKVERRSFDAGAPKPDGPTSGG